MGKSVDAIRPPGPEKHWFAAYTTCRHEKRVARHLEERGIEHFLPTYRTQRRWKDGSRVTLNLPLFPGYVFVRICGSARVRVLEVPGVVSMIGTASSPIPLPDLEIDTLRTGLDPLRVEPHPLLTVGQRVRIKIGALAGIEGIVIRRKGGFRLVLTLDLLMQSIAIEVDGDDVELADTLSPLTLESKDKEVGQSQRAMLYEFKCLDSYPESQVLLSAANVVRR
jgi:transcription antitermination factor NusG